MLAYTLIGHRSRLTWFALRSLFFLIVSLPVMYSSKWKDEESSTDGVLWERVSQQTFLECLFNVKCNKCWGVGRLDSLCFRGKCSAYQSMRASEWFHKYQWIQTCSCPQSPYTLLGISKHGITHTTEITMKTCKHNQMEHGQSNSAHCSVNVCGRLCRVCQTVFLILFSQMTLMCCSVLTLCLGSSEGL